MVVVVLVLVLVDVDVDVLVEVEVEVEVDVLVLVDVEVEVDVVVAVVVTSQLMQITLLSSAAAVELKSVLKRNLSLYDTKQPAGRSARLIGASDSVSRKPISAAAASHVPTVPIGHHPAF